MLVGADLDTAEGLVKLRDMLLDTQACFPAVRFFTEQIAAGALLRDALADMHTVNADAATWGMWAIANLPVDAKMRLHFLTLACAGDPGLAAYMTVTGDVSEEERATLLTFWHSAHRADGAVLLPEYEKLV